MTSELVRIQAEGYMNCLITGLVMGLIGACICLLRKMLKPGPVITWIGVILFWLVLSGTIIALNYICCDGRVRLYIFLGFFSGFLISFYTINWVASKISTYILYKKKDG